MTKEERDQLIVSRMGLVKHIVRSFNAPQYMVDDLVSTGYETLIRCVDNYKPIDTFNAYVSASVRGAIIGAIKKANGMTQANKPFISYESDFDLAEHIDSGIDVEYEMIKKEISSLIRHEIANIGIKSHRIIVWECFQGKDQRQIAKNNKTDLASVRKIYLANAKKIIRKIRKIINGELAKSNNINDIVRSASMSHSPLSEEKVREIKKHLKLRDLSIRKIADKFNVSDNTIRMISNGTRWWWVNEDE